MKISEVDFEFEMKFVMTMEWFDHRFSFHNLKNLSGQNVLTEQESQAIWIPYVVFTNTKNNEATEYHKNAQITVSRRWNFSLSESSEMHEINIFPGKENSIKFEKSYTKTFRCDYALNLYPFDTQVNYFYYLTIKSYRSNKQ